MDELKKQKHLEFEKRQIERTLFRKCGHTFKDVTKERRRLIEARGLPSWVKYLMEKDPPDRQWANRREVYKTSKFEKCTGCGLLKISDELSLGG